MSQAIDQSDALIGRTLGEFVIEELIGEGGFGRVYRATQPALQREAVIKVQSLSENVEDFDTDRFLREARLASRLDHPFAAHIYAFGAEPDNLLWIAMELVRGTPLDRVLVESPLALERAIPFLRRLCEVVHTAHEQDIVHRDLKPANVMVVARAGNVFPKLLDLGIAKDVNKPSEASPAERLLAKSRQLAATGPGRMGTPYYMAPEQWINAKDAGPPADIYALGVLTFEVLVGHPPFQGDTVIEIAKQHARSKPPPLPDGFPPQLSEAIARAMSKRAKERFPTALAFAEALIESSGIALDSVNLPTLDELTREEVLVRAPQPIAETAAAIDSARNPEQAMKALWGAAHACAQYVGVVTLACRSRVGAGRYEDSKAATLILDELRIGELDTDSWWRLAREMARPFQSIPDAHPIPELVALFFDGSAELRTAMDELLKARPDKPSDVRGFLAGAVPALAAALRSLSFLSDYPIAALRDGKVELWMGMRRPSRAAATTTAALEESKPHLLDSNHLPVVSLWPAVQCGAPSPNQPAELFILSGAHRGSARLIAPPVGFERRDDQLFEALDIALEVDAGDGASESSQAPYLGLRTFTQDDADSFFGREREVEAFVNRLKTNTLIAVVGPSGAGKSSFVRAGVLPSLAGSWRPVVARPGASPIEALLSSLREIGLELAREDIEADENALGDALRGAAKDDGLVVVIDQFEELFTLCLDPEERNLFARALVAAPRHAEDRVRVLLTLRDDFLVRAVQVPALRERLTGNLQVLATPLAEDMRRILVEPARRAGYEFEDEELPDEMVKEVADVPGALALLSFTAFRLWQFRDRHFRKLPRKAYRALGGVGGALAQHAEATLDELEESERDIVREIFRHLITADGTRAIMSRSELLQVSGGEPAQSVLEALINARLLTAMEGDGDDEHIEVVHEALLSAWPRVVRWRQDDAQNARLRDQLRVAARQWSERNQPRGLLWRGDALAELRIWRARYGGSLTDTEEAFAKSSVDDAARGRRLRRGAVAIIILALAVALAIFVRLRGVAEVNRQRAETSATALDSEMTASFEEQGRRALIEGDTSTALLYLERALSRGADSPDIRFMLARALDPLSAEIGTLAGHASDVSYVGYSPNGNRIFTSSTDGTVRLWNSRTLREEHSLAGHPKAPVHATYSHDSRFIATASVDAIVRLWNANDGVLVHRLEGHQGPITALSFSLDGTELLSASGDGTIRVWRTDDGTELRSIRVAAAGTDVSFDLDSSGTRIAVGTFNINDFGGGVSLWSTSGAKLADLEGHQGGVGYVRFDADGKRIATASTDQTSRVFDAQTGKTLAVLRGHDNRVTDVRWAPDGSAVVTGSADTMIKRWNPSTGAIISGMRAHTAQVNRVRFNNSGSRLLSVASDGSAKLWAPSRGVLLATLSHGGFLFDGAFSPDDKQAVTASQLGTAKVWRVEGTGPLASFAGKARAGIPVTPVVLADEALAHLGNDAISVWKPLGTTRRRAIGAPLLAATAARDQAITAASTGPRIVVWSATDEVILDTTAGSAQDPILSLELDPSGQHLATVTQSGRLSLFDVARNRRVASTALGQLGSGVPWQLVWSPSGKTLVAISINDPDKPSTLFDGANLTVLDRLGLAYLVVFSRDGSRMAVIREETIDVLDAAGKKQSSMEPSSTPTTVAWTADGAHLLVGQGDGVLSVWRAHDGTMIGQTDAHDVFIPSVTSSADGALIATVGFNTTVKVWSANTLRQLHVLRVGQGTNWASFLSDGRLVTSNGSHIDVWSGSRYGGTAASLSKELRCRLPFQLKSLTVVPVSNFKPCAAEELE